MADQQGQPGFEPAPVRPYLYPPGQLPDGVPPAPTRTRRRRWERAGGTAAAGGGVAAKAGLLTKLFLALKASVVLVKFKFALSMAVSVIAYAFIFGWWYAVGFVALIAVHELGHVVAMRFMGSRRRCRPSSRSWAPL